jgi:hypothetical protein
LRLRASFINNLSFLLVSLCAVLQAQSKPPRYVVKDLSALPGSSFSQPGQLSNNGNVAGVSIAPDRGSWRKTKPQDHRGGWPCSVL